MRLYDYKYSPASDKNKWMETFRITSGFKYFGGKQFIGKYLMNRLLNMAVRMQEDGKKADIFIDVFTGGGKLGLSVPEGWFDEIVINDLDFGVVSYFKSCKKEPDKLINMIERLGGHMDENVFKAFVYNRCNDSDAAVNEMKKTYHNSEWISDQKVDRLLAGAMTYWVVQSSFNGCTSPDKASYTLNAQDRKEKRMNEQPGLKDKEKRTYEKEAIRNIIENAKKRIPELHRIMKQRNITVERLDYRELIKKYNGKQYQDLDGNTYPADNEGEENQDIKDQDEKKQDEKDQDMESQNTENQKPKKMSEKNKLWYFDPPYHPSTLSGGEAAPYMNTFPLDMVHEMTKILHNDYVDTYGELEYFIKSDYNPKYRYEEECGRRVKDQNLLSELKKAYHDFDSLEENDKHSKYYKGEDGEINYYVECIGNFVKGAVDETGEKTTGKEYIWCRGNYQEEKGGTWNYADPNPESKQEPKPEP